MRLLFDSFNEVFRAMTAGLNSVLGILAVLFVVFFAFYTEMQGITNKNGERIVKILFYGDESFTSTFPADIVANLGVLNPKSRYIYDVDAVPYRRLYGLRPNIKAEQDVIFFSVGNNDCKEALPAGIRSEVSKAFSRIKKTKARVIILPALIEGNNTELINQVLKEQADKFGFEYFPNVHGIARFKRAGFYDKTGSNLLRPAYFFLADYYSRLYGADVFSEDGWSVYYKSSH